MSLKDLYNKVKSLWETVPQIVTSGSNAQGEWVKFSDGTVHQYGTSELEASDDGSIHVVQCSVSLPIAMVSFSYGGYTLSEMSTGSSAVDSRRYGLDMITPSTDKFELVRRATDQEDISDLVGLDIAWTTVGRWK